MAGTAISIDKLTKRFPAPGSGDEFVVLDDISLTADEGKFVSIVGPSGCGKSTLLNVIAGIEAYVAASSPSIRKRERPRRNRISATCFRARACSTG